MKINPIGSSMGFLFTNPKKDYERTFKAQLQADNKVIERMSKDNAFRDVIFKFQAWLESQLPKDGVVKIVAKRGKIIGYLEPRYQNASLIPIAKACREDLEFSMNEKSSGFYYNPLNNSDNILEDLKYIYECIK